MHAKPYFDKLNLHQHIDFYMSVENLIQKANNNSKTAEWAENSAYYDVSISRYYYCLYEKAIYIAIKKGFYSYTLNKKDSHNIFIASFQKNVAEELSNEEIDWLANLGKLKDIRNDADYKLAITDANHFKLGFKYYYQQINSILDKLII